MILPPSSPIASSRLPDSSDTRLHGRWLRLSRMVWLVVVIGTLALFVGGLPAYYALLQQPCVGGCNLNGGLNGTLSRAAMRTLQAAGFSVTGYTVYTVVFTLVIALLWAVVGLVIFWRRSDDWVALLVAFVLITYPAGQTQGPITALTFTAPAWTLPVEVTGFLSQAAIGLLFCLFPGGRFAPRWVRWVLALYLLWVILSIFPPVNSPLNETNWSPALSALVLGSIFACSLFSQIYRYRRVSDAVQRQQIKWAVFGISLALVLFGGVAACDLALNRPGSLWEAVIYTLWSLVALPIPFFFGMAILRSRLWDIDTLINKALVYGGLSGLLGALYAGLIIGLESLSGLFGGTAAQNPVVLVISTLVIAAVFQPVRKRLQASIDRRFYRRKYDAEKMLAAFSAQLRNEVDLELLRKQVLSVVQETMQPVHVSLWLRSPERHRAAMPHSLEPYGSAPTKPSDG